MYITFHEGNQRVNYKMPKKGGEINWYKEGEGKKRDKEQSEYCLEVVSEHSKLQNMFLLVHMSSHEVIKLCFDWWDV